MLDLIWLIPLVPLLGVALNGLLGKRWLDERLIGTIACGVVLVSFLLSVGAVWALAALPPDARHHEVVLYDWIPAGLSHLGDGSVVGETARFTVPFGFQLDPLSAVMILVVTGVGFLIHVYATGYMHGDPGYYRFFAYLNLFAAFMLILVLGNSYGMMFIGWEGVGLCSYLLIGYYFSKRSAGDAGKKAFVVNRVGDLAFLLGMFTIFTTFGTLDYDQVMTAAAANFSPGAGVITAITLFLFIGATGKSAQIPLYTWLPDAMEGPTPVSALIHAATMVTAGVYMVVRSNVLYSLAPLTMTVVAVIGALTALLAALIALVQNDIKRVLAYSTISQLGYMFLACGVGAYAAGIFHLVTHAFFKALLFLAAGSVMHALAGELDMWKMGGLRKYMPTTYWTFLVATLAIAGIPPLAGFFSKDEILWSAWSGPNSSLFLWALGTAVAGLTAFYMFRMLWVTFHGESRMDPHVEEHVHESPPLMTYPLIALAVLTMLGGFIGIPAALRAGPLASVHGAANIYDWLQPVVQEEHGVEVDVLDGDDGHGHGAAAALSAAELRLVGLQEGGAAGQGQETEAAEPPLGQVEEGEHHEDTATELLLMAVSLLVAGTGIFVAYRVYLVDIDKADALAERFSGAYRTLWNKFRVDEAYDALFVNRVKDSGDILWAADDALIDGVVNGTAWSTVRTSEGSVRFDNTVVDGAVNGVGSSLQATSWLFRALQTGFVQNYVFVIVLGMFVLVSAYLFF